MEDRVRLVVQVINGLFRHQELSYSLSTEESSHSEELLVVHDSYRSLLDEQEDIDLDRVLSHIDTAIRLYKIAVKKSGENFKQEVIVRCI